MAAVLGSMKTQSFLNFCITSIRARTAPPVSVRVPDRHQGVSSQNVPKPKRPRVYDQNVPRSVGQNVPKQNVPVAVPT